MLESAGSLRRDMKGDESRKNCLTALAAVVLSSFYLTNLQNSTQSACQSSSGTQCRFLSWIHSLLSNCNHILGINTKKRLVTGIFLHPKPNLGGKIMILCVNQIPLRHTYSLTSSGAGSISLIPLFQTPTT